MERKIGKKFEYNGRTYVALEKSGCTDCNDCTAIRNSELCEFFGDCTDERKDGKNVVFREVVHQPFSVELAKLGKPVTTRGGKKARIICFDRENSLGYHIVALIGEEETVGLYNDYGVRIGNKCGEESENDLVMEVVTYDGWIAIIPCSGEDCRGKVATALIFSTADELRKHIKEQGIERRVACIMPIEWGV